MIEIKDESTLETLEEVTDALEAFNHANSDVGNAIKDFCPPR